jgi:SAM-dependent methyltransferase
MASDELDELRPAYSPGFKFHDENLSMLSWYAQRMIGCLRREKRRRLVSLGLGHQVVCDAILRDLLPALERYTIVEGSRAILDDFTARRGAPPGVELVHALFEEFEPRAAFDAVELGFVLEHVDDAAAVLRRYAGLLAPGGTAIIVVPNARSLHRLIGHAAGLLDNVHRLSEQDLELGHKRYFDLDSLVGLITGAGLRIRLVEGVMLKPVTTRQLASLALPPAVIDGLFQVGVGLPAIANAIYVEAMR